MSDAKVEELERANTRLQGWIRKALHNQRCSAVANVTTTTYLEAALTGAPSDHEPGCTRGKETCSCGYWNALTGRLFWPVVPVSTQSVVEKLGVPAAQIAKTVLFLDEQITIAAEEIAAIERAIKRHRCMRCKVEFECPHGGDACQANYDVLPTMVHKDGSMTEHCPPPGPVVPL